MRIRTIFVGGDAALSPHDDRFYDTLRQICHCPTGGQGRPPLQNVLRCRRWCVQFCSCVLPGRCGHRPLQTDCVFASVHSFVVGVPCRADRVVRLYGCVPFRIICGVVPAGGASRSPTLRLKLFAYVSSKIFPSTEMVTTFHGTNLPLACNAVLAACSSPPQQGTSMRTTVTLWMLFVRKISVSFCA